MAAYKPRSSNYRHGQKHDAPHAWSQQFYDSRPPRTPEVQCGFHIPENTRCR